MSAAILCGNGCGHDHNSPNGPSGCCDRHGAYLYYCPDCHGEWRAANSDRAAQIERLARASLVDPQPTDSDGAS